MNIGDFAKDLLFEMKFGKGGDTEDLGIGKVRALLYPVIDPAKAIRSQSSSLFIPWVV